MKKYLPALTITALLLTGCGGGNEVAPAATSVEVSEAPTSAETPVVSEPSPLPAETTEDAPAITGPGTYAFETETGTAGTIAVPGAIPAEIEELRQLVGGEPTTFITAEVDNRKGAQDFIFYELWVYDPAGIQHVYVDVSNYISELSDMLPEDAPAETYNRFVDLQNSITGDTVQALEARTILLVGDEVPAEITGVEISTGYDQVPTTFQQ